MYFDQEYFETNQKSLRLPVQTFNMAQKVVFMFLVTLIYVIFVVTRSRHEVLESPREVSYESVKY